MHTTGDALTTPLPDCLNRRLEAVCVCEVALYESAPAPRGRSRGLWSSPTTRYS
jgi:hypothetical protein